MKHMISMPLQVCAVLLMISVPFAKGGAQDGSSNQWERNVKRQLRIDAAKLADYDIVASHEIFTGTLHKNYYRDIDYTLEAGVRYIFVGACDQDCTDLDLKLFDGNWNLIDSDTKPDATPFVTVTVTRGGVFHMRVIMEACHTDPCWFGVGAYKPAGD